MTNLSQQLLTKAAELQEASPYEVAVGLLKEAGFTEADARRELDQQDMEKEACSQLTMAGIDIDTAVKMVKAAGVHLKDLASYESETLVEDTSSDLMQKAAQYIDSLEAEIDALTKSAQDNAYSEVVLPTSITKAASNGAFTNEDLAALQKMDSEVLTKIASVMEQPWEMGQASGYSRPVTDPLLEFMLGNG
jgi:hypothetical protein